ncbi:MAG: hypothetical protein L0I76_19925 [Pseudonocardia sp.]|nr:hypothetical protein [Pseudonocardia sp.]
MTTTTSPTSDVLTNATAHPEPGDDPVAKLVSRWRQAAADETPTANTVHYVQDSAEIEAAGRASAYRECAEQLLAALAERGHRRSGGDLS